jgi:manganese-dependent inorganic pyrophosphatase
MTITNTTLVIGHRNPDTDAVASALGYTWLLNQNAPGQFYAGRAGELNNQTTFALQHFNIDAPPLVSDVRARVRDIVENAVPFIKDGQTLHSAVQRMSETKRPVALLENNRKPLGLVTAASMFALLAEPLSADTANPQAIESALSLPLDTALDSTSFTLNEQDYLRDVMAQVMRTEPVDFIVVDEKGQYVGLCKVADMLRPPRQKVILVDHNEASQAVSGLEEADVIEVLDHHRVGSVETLLPIRFDIDPVGSCSTLVAERAIQSNRIIPTPIAGMLLCGVLSDTLVFRSPTTTARDRAVSIHLAQMAGLTADIETLGQQLLASGAGLGTRPASAIVNSDLKFYEVGGKSIGIAQVEITDFSELGTRLNELRDELQQMVESRKLALALLLVTDVLRGDSRMIAVGNGPLIEALPYPRLQDKTLNAPGVVSRKKQLLPTVLAAAAALG